MLTMKKLLVVLFVFGLLVPAPAATIVPAVDNTSCTTTNQPMLYQGSSPANCVQGGQIPSMGGGRAPSTIWIPTAGVTIATTGETSCFSATGQGPGRTITGGVPYAGNEFFLHCAGTVTTPIGGGTVTIKVKWGSVAVATLSGAALTVSLTNQPWTIDANCTMQSVSGTASSSTMVCSGLFSGGPTVPTNFGSVSAATVDTTANQLLDMTWTWGVVTTQTATVNDAVAEIRY
jgi:hypothetical protein